MLKYLLLENGPCPKFTVRNEELLAINSTLFMNAEFPERLFLVLTKRKTENVPFVNLA